MIKEDTKPLYLYNVQELLLKQLAAALADRAASRMLALQVALVALVAADSGHVHYGC